MKKFILALTVLAITSSSFAKSQKVVSETSPEIVSLAWIDQVKTLPAKTVNGKWVKLLSSVGHTAMNGTTVMLAVYNEDEKNFNVFKLANTQDYKLLPSKRDGFLKIALTSDDINADGSIVQVQSTLFVNLLNSDKVNGSLEIEEIH